MGSTQKLLTRIQRTAIANRRPFVTAGVLIGYVTKGGTYTWLPRGWSRTPASRAT